MVTSFWAMIVIGLGVEALGSPASLVISVIAVSIFAVLIGLGVYIGRLIQQMLTSHNAKNKCLKIWNSISINFLIKLILILGVVYLISLLTTHFFPAKYYSPNYAP